MTKNEALDGLEKIYHGIQYAYFDDDAIWDEYAIKHTTDFLYYPHKGIPIAIKIITEEDEIVDISIHFNHCQNFKKYPLFLFLKPNVSHNAVFASNYNTACFSLTESFSIQPFRVKNKQILYATKQFTLNDFICTSKFIYNQNFQWVKKEENGIVSVVEEFYDDKGYYNCYISEKLEFRTYKELKALEYRKKLKGYFDNEDYNSLFIEFEKIIDTFLFRHNLYDYDDNNDFKSDCMIQIWEKILNKEFYYGDNIPKYVNDFCYNILRNKQKQYAVRRRIIEENPDFIVNMKENRDSTFDEYVSIAPKQKRKSSLSTIFVYDKLTNQLVGEYDSIVEASKATNTDTSNISKCIKGKLKSTNGYKFSI